MEQNQSQPQPPAQTQDQQWQNARNEFASEGETISQAEDVAALVQKWVWIQHEDEFRDYERQLAERSNPAQTLPTIIADLIQLEKQESWMINQRYTMDQVNQIIAKLRHRLREVLNVPDNLNPEAQPPPQQPEDKEEPHDHMDAQLNYTHTEKETLVNSSSLLPEIKQKGRVYNPQDMHSSFHLLKQTEEEYKMLSPGMFSERRAPKEVRESLFNNKYLRQAFKWLSKQGYNSKGLFEDFSKEGDRMTLNKWMVFCKEFDFTEKIPRKDLVSIFQTATAFSTCMFLEDFLSAVALLQDKYVSRFHKGEQNFVADVLHIDSEAAFKVKMDNLKVNYSGPRKNFFQYATYSQHERIDEIQKEKQFQVKKRDREIVLIKGMFEDHLKDQVRQLKANREKLKATRLGSSLNMIEIKEKSKEKEPSYRTARLQDINYSKLFHINRGLHQESNTTTTGNTNSQFPDKMMYKTEQAKPHKVQHKRIDADNKKSEPEQKKSQGENKRNENKSALHPRLNPSKPTDPAPKQAPQIIEEAPMERTWLTNVRSDSEESDDILKEHLQFEKKVKETKVEALMREMRERSKQVDKIKEQMAQEEPEDADMVETQAHFNKQKKVIA